MSYSVNIDEYSHFMIVDLEATCSDNNTIPREEMEIIEIGAVMVQRNTFLVLDEFTVFIKPVIHPVLTEFCTRLTSITQENVNNGLGFSDALRLFNDWWLPYCSSGPVLFCSWGEYDKNQLKMDCTRHSVPYPLGDVHLNIKNKFSQVQGRKKRYGLRKAMILTNTQIGGTLHRGIDDAKNMAKLMPYIMGNKRIDC